MPVPARATTMPPMPEPTVHQRRPADTALLLLLAALWGSSYTLIRVGVETIAPLTLIAARTLIAGLLLLAWLRWRGVRMPRGGREWWPFAVQSLLNSVFPFTLIAWAEQWVPAGVATILNSLSPVFTFLLGAAMGGERTSLRKLAGVAAGLGGVVLVVGAQALHGLGSQVLPQLAIVLSSLCYAGAALFGKRFNGLDPAVPAAGSLLSGAVLLVPASLLLEHPWTMSPSARSVAALLALSVLSTALALAIYFRLMRAVGPVGVTAQAYLRVPFGVGIGVGLLGEALPATAWMGSVLVVAAVAALTFPGRKRAGA